MAASSRLDLDAMLEPISEDSPSGEYLDGSENRYKIEDFFRMPPASIEAPEKKLPEAHEVKPIVTAVLADGKLSHDFDLAVFYIRAGAASGSCAMMRDGAKWLEGLVEAFWDTLNPDPTDEDNDFDTRTAGFRSLATKHGLFRHLELTPIVDGPHGTFTLGDVDQIAIDGESADSYANLKAALAANALDEFEEAQGLFGEFVASLKATHALLVEKAGDDDDPPSMVETFDRLDRIVSGFEVSKGAAEVSAAGDDAAQMAGGAAAVPMAAMVPARSGPINSRSDVTKAIDLIVEYYERHEPGSPIPVALGKVRSWVDMDFMALLQEIVPDSASSAKLLFESEDDRDR
ncbi:MAG: type VI secretion system ImpA family N-terminal domain-containing protein [Pseudomonadota bacterium]